MRAPTRTGLAAALVLCATAGPLALSGSARAATALECIGIVVDPAGSGSPRAPDTFCATVPYGATGAQVLAARAKALNRPQPRYQGGLLCAIDGYPRTGCGESDSVRGGYDYWSYWHKKRGTSQWVYSGSGLDQYSPVPGDLEGWAFQEGGAEGGRMPPDVSAESVCARARPAASTPTSSPASKKPAPSPSPSPSPRVAVSATPSVDAPTPSRGARPSPSPIARRASPAAHPAPAVAKTSAPTPTVVVASAVPDAAPAASSKSGAPVGAIVAGAAVLVLAAGAFVRFRTTRR